MEISVYYYYFLGFPHHVQYLLQGQAELEGHRLALLYHWSLQLLVVSHQVIQQSPLVGSPGTSWESEY